MTILNLNATIGMRVFGYAVLWQPRFQGDDSAYPCTQSPPYYVPENERYLHTESWFLPSWSVDLDKALQVVQMMNLKGFAFDLRHESWGGHWVASFGTTLADRVFGDSDLPAMAICAAALAVFGIEIPENQISVRGRKFLRIV